MCLSHCISEGDPNLGAAEKNSLLIFDNAGKCSLQSICLAGGIKSEDVQFLEGIKYVAYNREEGSPPVLLANRCKRCDPDYVKNILQFYQGWPTKRRNDSTIQPQA